MDFIEMKQPKHRGCNVFLLISALTLAGFSTQAWAQSTTLEIHPSRLADNEEADFFVGNCSNGTTYRLHAYQRQLEGSTQSFYEYEGPAGKGSVRTNASPKKMAIRVCRATADIHDASRFN